MDMREFMKGGANIHVKSHYRMHNGKLVYVHEHDKLGSPVGTEAQLHERVQHSPKNPQNLMAIDPEDRDTVLKHASSLGLKPEVKYQGGKIHDHEGKVEKHGFHFIKFANEEDAKKVHAMLHGGQEKPAESPAQQTEPEQPEGKAGTHPNDLVKEAEQKFQNFISFGHAQAIQHAISGTIPAEKGIELADQGLELAQAAVDAADAYEKEVGQAVPKADTYRDIVAQLNAWKSQLQEKLKPAETSNAEPENKSKATKEEAAKPEPAQGEEKTLPRTDRAGINSPENVAKVADIAKQAMEKTGKTVDDIAYTLGKTHGKDFVDQVVSKLKSGEKPAEPAQESSPYPSGWDDNPSYHLKDLMQQANANFHDNPQAAIDALKKGAALAKKHGIDYTHGNGMNVNADWMEKKAGEMEAALSKDDPTPAVDEGYAKASKVAMDASRHAHSITNDYLAAKENGEMTPEHAQEAMSWSQNAGLKHIDAKAAHKAAAEKAPTPELKQFHEKKAEEHDHHATVHNEAAKMHEKQHKKNLAQDSYDTEATKADSESQTANDHTKEVMHSQSSEDHENAAGLHGDAARAHTGMIQHALANGDEQAAKEHASISTQHWKKAAYHKAAAAAWKATNEKQVGHGEASKLHAAASQAAKESGMGEKVATGHDNYAKAHAEQAKKKAEEASDDAKDWSWSTDMDVFQHGHASKAHNKAGGAHMKAAEGVEGADQQAHYAKAKHHSEMVDYHNKAGQASETSSEANTFHGVGFKHNSAEHEHAAKLHAKAASEHEALAQHPGIKASQKHQEFHTQAAAHHKEMSEKHTKFAASQKAGEAEDAAGDDEAVKKPDFSKYDHAPIAKKGLEAYQSGDWAEAAKNLKQAAVIALHKGNKEEANGYAAKAKAAMLKLTPIQKAIVEDSVGKDTLRIMVMESARAVHKEKLQVRNMLKAVDTMPSFGNLQKACAQATRAGITDLDTIVAHALGGKQQAAPYLKFIAAIQ